MMARRPPMDGLGAIWVASQCRSQSKEALLGRNKYRVVRKGPRRMIKMQRVVLWRDKNATALDIMRNAHRF
jgi:hypothetical protein